MFVIRQGFLRLGPGDIQVRLPRSAGGDDLVDQRSQRRQQDIHRRDAHHPRRADADLPDQVKGGIKIRFRHADPRHRRLQRLLALADVRTHGEHFHGNELGNFALIDGDVPMRFQQFFIDAGVLPGQGGEAVARIEQRLFEGRNTGAQVFHRGFRPAHVQFGRQSRFIAAAHDGQGFVLQPHGLPQQIELALVAAQLEVFPGDLGTDAEDDAAQVRLGRLETGAGGLHAALEPPRHVQRQAQGQGAENAAGGGASRPVQRKLLFQRVVQTGVDFQVVPGIGEYNAGVRLLHPGFGGGHPKIVFQSLAHQLIEGVIGKAPPPVGGDGGALFPRIQLGEHLLRDKGSGRFHFRFFIVGAHHAGGTE